MSVGGCACLVEPLTYQVGICLDPLRSMAIDVGLAALAIIHPRILGEDVFDRQLGRLQQSTDSRVLFEEGRIHHRADVVGRKGEAIADQREGDQPDQSNQAEGDQPDQPFQSEGTASMPAPPPLWPLRWPPDCAASPSPPR